MKKIVVTIVGISPLNRSIFETRKPFLDFINALPLEDREKVVALFDHNICLTGRTDDFKIKRINIGNTCVLNTKTFLPYISSFYPFISETVFIGARLELDLDREENGICFVNNIKVLRTTSQPTQNNVLNIPDSLLEDEEIKMKAFLDFITKNTPIDDVSIDDVSPMQAALKEALSIHPAIVNSPKNLIKPCIIKLTVASNKDKAGQQTIYTNSIDWKDVFSLALKQYDSFRFVFLYKNELLEFDCYVSREDCSTIFFNAKFIKEVWSKKFNHVPRATLGNPQEMILLAVYNLPYNIVNKK